MTSPTFRVIQILHFPLNDHIPIKTHWNPLNSMVTFNEIPLEHGTCPKKKKQQTTQRRRGSHLSRRRCVIVAPGKKFGEVRDTNGSAVEVNDIYK
jgi:hypothetical protein